MIPERWLHLLGALLAVTLVRGSAVFLVTYVVTSLAKNLSGEARHVIWLGVIASFLLIPLAWLALPGVQIGARIPLEPAAQYRLAAAPVLSRADYAQLVDRAGMQAAVAEAQPSASGTIFLALPFLWLAGMLGLVVRLTLGKARLLRLAAEARGDARLQGLVDELAGEFAIRRSITLLLSPRCRIPFTFRIRRPVVLLPQAAAGWPAGRLRSAFTHELAHIQRRDLIAQTAGYAICVLFWFIPLLWLAYSAMLREAETCCDQQVINRGFRGPEYAQDIVDLARSCEGRILLPSISSVIGRRSMLKERVKKVLSLKPGRRPFGTRGSVRVLAICLACVVPILALTAQTKPAEDPLPGTWVNEEYGTSKGMSQRFVIFPDGRELHYMMMTDKEPWFEYKSVIEARWRDAQGNFWYKSRFMGWYYGFPAPSEETCGDKGYALVRINASGTTIEGVQAESRYPDEEDWSLMPHGIYYKQP